MLYDYDKSPGAKSTEGTELSIDPGQPIPLYFQLKTLIVEEILAGRYGPDRRLPTEHELCRDYGISRTPVSRALSELAEEGVILRHRRRGTFVNPHWLRRRPDRPEVRVLVPEEGPWKALAREAAEAEGIPVSVVFVPRSELHQAVTHAVAEGRAPDFAVVDSVWLPEFAAAGFLHPFEELDPDWVRDEYERDFLPPPVAATRYQAQTFGVSAFADVAGIWYRRDELERAGLEPPATWEGLRALARAVAGRSRRLPVVLPGGARGGETTTYWLIALLASNGAEVLGRDGVALSSAATVDALAFLRRLLDERLVPAEVVGYEWNRPIRLLAEGRAAVSFGGSYEGRALSERLGLSLDELWSRVGFVPVPAGPDGEPASVAGTMAHAVFRQSAQPLEAVRLIRRIVEPASLARVALATGRIPARASAVELAAPRSAFLAQTAEILRHAVIRPSTPLYPRVSDQLAAMLEAVLTARLEPAAAAHRAAEMIGAITGLPLAAQGEPLRSAAALAGPAV